MKIVKFEAFAYEGSLINSAKNIVFYDVYFLWPDLFAACVEFALDVFLITFII
jgi:hypothetical protein